jgi:hypothetical protein
VAVVISLKQHRYRAIPVTKSPRRDIMMATQEVTQEVTRKGSG